MISAISTRKHNICRLVFADKYVLFVLLFTRNFNLTINMLHPRVVRISRRLATNFAIYDYFFETLHDLNFILTLTLKCIRRNNLCEKGYRRK